MREVIGPIAAPDVIHWAPGRVFSHSCLLIPKTSTRGACDVLLANVLCRPAQDEIGQDHAAHSAKDRQQRG